MSSIALEYQRSGTIRPDPLYKGLDKGLNHWAGVYARRASRQQDLLKQAAQIAEASNEFSTLSEGRMREQLEAYQQRFRRRPDDVDAEVSGALALLREAAFRSTGMRPYPVQLAGALALHQGFLAEMATGEGKTLTAALAAVLAGWTRRPCHIITVNDYLAQRDAGLFKKFYRLCGLRCGFVLGEMDSDTRRAAYSEDITYTTSKEITADYLRDRLRLGQIDLPVRRELRRLLQSGFAEKAGMVMRGTHTAIVDEADSVLIDEAVTPVLISRPYENKPLVRACHIARDVVQDFVEGEDYEVDLRYKEVKLTDAAKESLGDRCANLPGLWQSESRRKELLEQALVAREFFHRGKQYVVDDGKVVIVDESTGRMMPMRSWREGLHQAIEAKEEIELSDPSETLARISFQRFFRQFKKLSGMTGTGAEAGAEFWHIYNLPVVTIPTNKPCVRELLPEQIFTTQEQKWDAVVADVLSLHQQGRPILLGTRNVTVSELLARRLDDLGLDYQLLNAIHHKEEAQIISKAGHQGCITIATNMAGRGTDILLGHGIAEQGGLHVISTERHESRRIDRQLFGRSARQGDPGSATAYVSLEDDLLKRFALGPAVGALKGRSLDVGAPAYKAAKALLDRTQKKAQRHAFRQREAVLKMDTWLEESLAFAE